MKSGLCTKSRTDKQIFKQTILYISQFKNVFQGIFLSHSNNDHSHSSLHWRYKKIIHVLCKFNLHPWSQSLEKIWNQLFGNPNLYLNKISFACRKNRNKLLRIICFLDSFAAAQATEILWDEGKMWRDNFILSAKSPQREVKHCLNLPPVRC